MKKIPMTSLNDNWKTPIKFKNELDKEFGFDFDPCPPDPTYDGLAVEWGKSNFVNPPFSNIDKWVKKGFEEAQKGKTVVFLIPSRTDTRWWHDYCMKASEIRFIKGRLKFEGAKYNAPFPSVVVVFKGNMAKKKYVVKDCMCGCHQQSGWEISPAELNRPCGTCKTFPDHNDSGGVPLN